MPKLLQYKIVKLQVESFKNLGFNTEFSIQPWDKHFAPKIRIYNKNLEYQLNNANWNTTSIKLARLYGVLKHEKRTIRNYWDVTNGD